MDVFEHKSNNNIIFPNQRVSDKEKRNIKWYADSIDFIINKATSLRDLNDINLCYEILKGNIPDEFYRKILNPYNSKNQINKVNFPAVMRNYDLIKPIIRRYIGEYTKNNHNFIVTARNEEIVINRKASLRKEITKYLEDAIANKIQETYNQFLQTGKPAEQFNIQDNIDIDAFIEEFNENYIDDIAEQGQNLLSVIKDLTNDTLFYINVYFNYVAFGEAYTYTDIKGEEIIKRCIPIHEAFPVSTENLFKEDDDMFCTRRSLTYNQVINEFGEYLTNEEIKYLSEYYNSDKSDYKSDISHFAIFERTFPDLCSRFNDKDRELFRETKDIKVSTGNIYVYHVTWKGEKRYKKVKYINPFGIEEYKIEDDDYKLDSKLGDISFTYIYKVQVYEGVRIGDRIKGIYPYGAREVAYNRNGKLPYNGIDELLVGFGKFSIIKLVIPHQVFYNIVSFHREMAVAKNKLNILLIAKSLLGKVPEYTIARMLSEGILYVDDTNDAGVARMNAIRSIDASTKDYINQLSLLLEEIQNEANLQVDMTPQRYGEIANTAGKGVTDEAINRGSMGSVIIEFMINELRKRDYIRDLDMSKLAWIDGLNTVVREMNGGEKFISLDIDKHLLGDYVVMPTNDINERAKLTKLQDVAFSASQNGDATMAAAIISADNISSVNKIIKKITKLNQDYQSQMSELEAQREKELKELELEKIRIKGEEDRNLAELKGLIDKEIAIINANSNIVSYDNNVSDGIKEQAANNINNAKLNIDRQKINIEREKAILDFNNKEKDRAVKREDIKAKLKIAKINKNKYDSSKRNK